MQAWVESAWLVFLFVLLMVAKINSSKLGDLVTFFFITFLTEYFRVTVILGFCPKMELVISGEEE